MFTIAGVHAGFGVGEVRLRISEEEGNVLFALRDTGVGIAEGQLERIFEPFHQAPTPNARRPGGTGLGLTVSRELARLLGGDVTVASVPDQGSTFTLRIPTAHSGEMRQERRRPL